MDPLDFIAFWRAQPFRPFMIMASGGRLIPVSAPSQIAMAPSMARFTIEADAGPISLTPADITACHIMKGPDPAAPAIAAPVPTAIPDFRLSPGGIELTTVSLDNGDRIVRARLSCADGPAFLSTADTDWDLHGLETFENGRSLYLHHPRDPFRTIRIIAWPPRNATFESFAEARPPAEIERELAEMQQLLLDSPPAAPAPPDRYWRDITPAPPAPEPSAPRGSPADRDDDPTPRYSLHIGAREAGPHHWTDCPRITDAWSGRAVLDLWDTNWDAHAEDLGNGRWRLTLRHFPQGGISFDAVIDAAARTAKVNNAVIPLAFFESHLLCYPCYNNWAALHGALTAGPLPIREPHIVLPLPDGWTLQLWPVDAALPLLTPRITSGDGRCVLDLRGSRWGATVQPWVDEDGSPRPRLSFRLINADPEDRSRMAMVWFTLDLPSRRITTDEYKGSTAACVLQHDLQTSRSWSGLTPCLTEAFLRGESLPLP